MTAIFDALCLSLIGIGFAGGVNYQGHLYLKHGADSRRALILVALLGYGCSQVFRKKSWVLRAVRQFWRLLMLRWFRWSVYLLCCGGAVQLAIAQANAMRFPLWDVGIFHQILWSLAHGLGWNSTISGAGDFLSDHFAPSLLLLVPLFRLFGESPLFLPVTQVLLLFGGGAAWIFLAERLGAGTFEPDETPSLRVGEERQWSASLAAATTVFILGFDSLWRNQRWGFHENAIAFCSLSWALALLFSSALKERLGLKTALIFGLFLVAAGSKEILLLEVSLGFLVWWGVAWDAPVRRSGFLRVFPFFKIAVSVALVVGFVAFEKMAHPVGKNYFNRYYAYLGNNLAEFIRSLVLSPSLVLSTIGMKSLAKYCGVVFLPWLFLFPVFIQVNVRSLRFSVIPEGVWLLMIVPSFASAALASYSPLREGGFHYVLELWPVLACVTLSGLARQKSAVLVGGWALISLFVLDFDPLGEYREFQGQVQGQVQRLERVELRQFIQKIPPDAAVLADELAGTWIAGRRWVARWPDTQLLPGGCPDFVLLEDPTQQRANEVQALRARCKGQTGISKASNSADEFQRAGTWILYKIE